METRLYFLGNAALADGFRLAGFEVLPDADEGDMESLLGQLHRDRLPAFVILDQQLYQSDSELLEEIRAESGRILLAQAPPLNDPAHMDSPVDQRIAQLLGQAGGAV